ncbi:MAG TPA: carboxypeptidase-like regulatory domain-containing protein, partial [Bacteroidia bacterium]|nr:carboxypeptidase-like regulatory domain-containing protein [Bacteroidia bacterium]
PGSYNIRFSILGYETLSTTGVRVSDGETVVLNKTLNFSNTLPVVRKEEYRIPLMPRNPNTPLVISYEDIKYAVDKNINALAASTAKVFQADAGEPISMSGSRYGTVKYIVDGVITENEPKLPGCAIEQISIYNSSIPACYGDATGGIIVITSKSYRF